MKNNLLVTVITCTYNSELTISDCIFSVKNQTYTNIEHLIIDGLSKDSTLQIIKEINTNCKIISEKDCGIYDAFNKGISNAKGDIIGFLHSDDIFNNQDVIMNIVKNFNDSDGVYGNLNYVNKINPEKIIRKWKSKAFNHSLLSRGWMPPHPTLFLKAKVYKKYNHFNLKYKVSADYDYIVRIFNDKSLKFTFIPEVFTNMRVGGNSNRSLSNIIRKSKEDYAIIKNNKIGNILTLFLKNITKIPQFFKI